MVSMWISISGAVVFSAGAVRWVLTDWEPDALMLGFLFYFAIEYWIYRAISYHREANA